jgi:hypothetical protein
VRKRTVSVNNSSRLGRLGTARYKNGNEKEAMSKTKFSKCRRGKEEMRDATH